MANVANGIKQPTVSILVRPSVHGAGACYPAACHQGTSAGGEHGPHKQRENSQTAWMTFRKSRLSSGAAATHAVAPMRTQTRELTMNDYVQVLDYAAEVKPRSSLVRRLVRARNDAVKLRARRWLRAIDDERLLDFGLSQQDIAELRGLPMPL
jgi:uncharacterized protein YjiS (DUF1127 family)